MSTVAYPAAVPTAPIVARRKRDSDEAIRTAAGAAVGFVCLGPVGAVAGAVIGYSLGPNNKRPRGVNACGVSQSSANGGRYEFLIRLPHDQIQEFGGVQHFAVDVFPQHGGQPWRVMKRYRDFDQLRNRLKNGARASTSAIERVAPFPGKHLMTCHYSKLEKRRRRLEAWLATHLGYAHGEYQKSSLRRFLNVPPVASSAGTQQLVVSAPVQHAPLPQPTNLEAGTVQAAGSSPAKMAIDVAPGAVRTGQPQGEMMEVEIPAGVTPGQTLMIVVPDGREASLTVPDGVHAGSSLTLFFDSQAGTLSRLERAPTGLPQGATSSTSAAAVQVDVPSTMLVQVPKGVVAGQSLAVELPSGRHANFCMPPGATEGQTLQLWHDPVNGTLTLMA